MNIKRFDWFSYWLNCNVYELILWWVCRAFLNDDARIAIEAIAAFADEQTEGA